MSAKKRGHGPPGRSPVTELQKSGIRITKKEIWIDSRIRDG